MESESLVGEDQSYGTSSRSFGSLAAAQSSSISLNSMTSNFASIPQSFLIPPLSHSTLSESFMSYTSSTKPGAGKVASTEDDTPENVDKSRVYQAAREAGRHAFGVVAVDVWMLDHGTFLHVPGGFWVNPVFAKRHPSDALERIVNPHHSNYSPPMPQVPGAGLAGYFWALGTERLIWRELKAITSDPLQPSYRRMNVLEEAGFGKATGIPFDILGHRGVVVYLTRENASETLLSDPTNVTFLRIAAQHIGAASALSKPRQLSMQAREQRITKKFRSVATKIHCVSAFSSLRHSLSNRSLQGLARSPSDLGRSLTRANSFMESQLSSIRRGFKEWSNKFRLHAQKRYTSLAEKCQGSNIKPPPAVPLSHALRAFVGSFLTFLALYSLSALACHETEHRIVLAPFGALLTLLFSLTAAPASQPRAIIYGQLICISVALLGNYYLIDLARLPIWFVVPLTTSAGIAIMTKLGSAHPPAAAVIVALFAQPDFSLMSGVFILAGNLVAISLAMLVNNLSETSQYPIYWGFGIQGAQQSLVTHANRMLLRRSPIEISRSSQEYIPVKRGPEASTVLSGADLPSFQANSYDASANLQLMQSNDDEESVPLNDLKSEEEEAMIYFSY